MDISALKKEQKEVVETYNRKKMQYSILIKQLIGIAIIFFVAIVNPIKIKDNLKLSVAILVISCVFLGINYLLIYIFNKKRKDKVLNFLNITAYIFFGILLKFTFYKINLKQFIICMIAVSLYITVLSIIVIKISKMKVPACIMIAIIIYLLYKYTNVINPYSFIILANSISYHINLKNAILKIEEGNYNKYDSIVTQTVLIFLFIAIVCCFINILKI